MKNRTQTVRKIVGFLNNPDEDGGFWLPNIQRPFVWKEEQIYNLFDSIMREYPIGTLLVWKTMSDIRHRKFIDNWKASVGDHISDFYVPDDSRRKCLILDGQQRLQALYIGLHGSFEGKELCFNILSGNAASPDDIRYDFKFIDPKNVPFPWVKFKDLVFTEQKPHVLRDSIVAKAGRALEEWEVSRIEDNIAQVNQTIKEDDTVTYQELDSVDNPNLYTEDDVVEVFIRANAGGTKLGKADLMFSLLASTWDAADDKMEVLLASLNQHGFSFDRDFVLKTCLVLLNQRAGYDVEKFRTPTVREGIEKQWGAIAAAIQDVLDFVRSKTFIQCDKALPSYLVLIPLINVRYKFPDAWKLARDVDSYILRCSLTGAFGGYSDTLIDAMVKAFDEVKGFDANVAYSVITEQRRSLVLTEDRLWQMGYGSGTIHLLFNLWYRGFGYTPAYDNNLPQVDHIFPQSVLRQVKALNPETGRMTMKYRDAQRNQLANCMLLSREENGAGGKTDMLPEEWFAGKDRSYLDLHLIPSDPALWRLERFEEFIEARKDLIRERFKDLLVSPVSSTLTSAYKAGKLETDDRVP
jgi:hypothetical protein